MKKHFVSKVSSFTIVAKSCILVEAGFKMNDYSFPKMLFLSLNFWWFHHILVTQLSVQEFQQETEFHFFKIFQSCFWDWHIHKLYYFYYKESRATDQLILFGTIPQSICLVQSKILAYFFIIDTFLHKQFAKTDRILWIKNISKKLVFFFIITKKWINFFTACI